MNKKLFIPIILGTNREDRESENVSNWIFEKLKEHENIETEIIDVRDFSFPGGDYNGTIKDKFPKYRDSIMRCDGIIIVSPEYNHSYPGKLKSVLDLLYNEYKNKALGVVSVSMGPWGGVRMIESLINVTRTLGLLISNIDLQFPNVKDTFGEDSKMKDEFVERYDKRLDKFLKELFWLSNTLKWGRENVS